MTGGTAAHVVYAHRGTRRIQAASVRAGGRLQLDCDGRGSVPLWLPWWLKDKSCFFATRSSPSDPGVPGGPAVDSALRRITRSYLDGDPLPELKRQAVRLGTTIEWAVFKESSAVGVIKALCPQCEGGPPVGFVCKGCGADR